MSDILKSQGEFHVSDSNAGANARRGFFPAKSKVQIPHHLNEGAEHYGSEDF